MSDKEFRGRIKLGTEVRVSDPCYSMNVWCAGTISNIKQGIYNCYVTFVDKGEWGVRVSAIELWHQNFDNSSIERPMDKVDFEVGVDSGQAGIFDLNYYIKNHPISNEWYDKVRKCTFSKGKLDANTMDNKCFVSSSGYGDGGYDCYTAQVNGKIVAIKIEFISDDE